MMTVFGLIAWLTAHAELLLIITTCLLGLEQWLASTAMLKANSTAQLISHFVEGLINVLRIVYKIASGKAMVTVLDGTGPVVTPAQPTPEVFPPLGKIPQPIQDAQDAAMFSRAFDAADQSIQMKKEG